MVSLGWAVVPEASVTTAHHNEATKLLLATVFPVTYGRIKVNNHPSRLIYLLVVDLIVSRSARPMSEVFSLCVMLLI